MATISLEQAARQLSLLRSRLPTLIGAEIVSFVLDNFEKQGYDTGAGIDKWKDRKDGSRPGGAVLVGKQSGRLRRSVRNIRQTRNSVLVGSDLPYAAIHNTGGVIRVPVTERSRKFFWAMWFATGEAHWKGMALTKKTTLLVNMPKRQFIGDSKALQKRIIDLIEKQVTKIFA